MFFLFVCLAPSARAETGSRAEMDQWLRHMGFRDFTAEIAEARKQQEKEVKKGHRKQVGLSPVAGRVMAFSEKRYQAVNDARDLATWMHEKVSNRIGAEASDQAVADFAARMLILQPQELPDEWPADVQTAAQREAFTTNFVAKQILNGAERVANDFITTAYGADRVKEILSKPGSPEHTEFLKDLAEVRAKTLSYVSLMQLDTELGQSNYLGDAVALSLVRASRKKSGQNGPLEAKMAASAIKHGTRLENTTTAEPVFKDANGKEVRVRVNNGSFVYEYSGHREAADIAFAGKPYLPGGQVKAFFKGILGNFVSRMVHWEDGNEPDMSTYKGRLRNWLADSRLFNHGISHVGQAFHNVDPETGLVHVEVRDLYPDPVFGGERIITMRNFAQDGPFRRLAVSTQDAEKLAKEFIHQVESSPDILKQWSSQVSKLDLKDDTVSAKRNKQEKQWPVLFNEADIKQWVELAKTDPKKFADLYAERSRIGWDFFLKQGVHFDTGFTDFLGAGYCAKGCVLAPKLTMGLDVEPVHSRLSFPLAFLSRWGVKGLEDLPWDRRFVAPVNLAVQPTVGDLTVLDYPAMTDRERQLSRTQPFVPFADPVLRNQLQAIPWSATAEGGHDDTFLGDLLGGVEDNVREYRLALDKSGPSKVLGGSYAARARAQREQKAKESEGEEAPEERAYNNKIGDRVTRVTEESHKGQSAFATDMQTFLQRMGLARYSADMEQAQKERGTVNELAAQTLKGNIERFRMVDTARDLATHILERAEPNMKDKAFRERFVKYAAGLLNVKPEASVKEVPWAVRQNPDLLARAEEVESYFEKAELEHGRQQLERLVSDYLRTMYGEEYLEKYFSPGAKGSGSSKDRKEFERIQKAIQQDVSRVSGLFAEYLYKIHLDPQIGMTQWLGRGVAMGVVRHARRNQDTELEKSFAEAVRGQDLFLENFVSNEIKLRDADGKIRSNEVHTGSFAFGRGRTRESIMIPSAALPADVKQARKEGLVGNILSYFVPVKEEKATMNLSPLARLRLGITQLNGQSPGFSHVGQFIVHEDAETGIKSTLIADNYPYHDESRLAGVRFVGLEHFGNENDYGWLGIANIDPEKFHEYSQEMVKRTREQGWDPIAWKSYKPTVNAEGKVETVLDPPRADWMKLITQEEFEKLHAEQDPKKWMAAWRAAVARGWYLMMLEGTHFSWVDNGAGTIEIKQKDGSTKKVNVPGRYWEQGTYCSQGCDIASIRMTGLPLEEPGKEGQWAGFVKFMAKWIPIPDAKAIDPTSPIVPPVNLALQKWIQTDERGNHIHRVQYPVASTADHQRASESPPGIETSLKITSWLRSAPAFLDVVVREQNAHIDPVERQNAIHAAMERTAVRAFASGAKDIEEVLGVDPEKVAEAREALEESPQMASAGGFLQGCQNAMAAVRGAVTGGR